MNTPTFNCWFSLVHFSALLFFAFNLPSTHHKHRFISVYVFILLHFFSHSSPFFSAILRIYRLNNIDTYYHFCGHWEFFCAWILSLIKMKIFLGKFFAKIFFWNIEIFSYFVQNLCKWMKLTWLGWNTLQLFGRFLRLNLSILLYLIFELRTYSFFYRNSVDLQWVF